MPVLKIYPFANIGFKQNSWISWVHNYIIHNFIIFIKELHNWLSTNFCDFLHNHHWTNGTVFCTILLICIMITMVTNSPWQQLFTTPHISFWDSWVTPLDNCTA